MGSNGTEPGRDSAVARRVTLRTAPSTARSGGIDALRAALTMLVVLHHTAITYGAQGSWFYQEIPPSSNPSSLILTVFCAVNQAWFMGLFFLIAGAFTPGSLDRHGLAGFARERLKRLGIPILAFLLLIGPVTVALARTAQGKPFLGTLAALAERGAYIIGPLWFVLALLVFSLLFGLWYGPGGGAQSVTRIRPFPANASLALGALLVGTTAFFLRLVWPVGTSVAGLCGRGPCPVAVRRAGEGRGNPDCGGRPRCGDHHHPTGRARGAAGAGKLRLRSGARATRCGRPSRGQPGNHPQRSADHGPNRRGSLLNLALDKSTTTRSSGNTFVWSTSTKPLPAAQEQHFA